ERSGDEPLARSSRYLSFALAAACPPILISHLGRPERFLHMLRVVKFKSPMSMGVWGLVGFSGVAALTAGAQLSRDGKVPEWLHRLEPKPIAAMAQAFLGAFIAGYTGVLLAATAIPVWAKGKAHIPAMCVCSALAGACAANSMLLAGKKDAANSLHKLERLEAVASIAELAVIAHFALTSGSTGKPMFAGERGKRFLVLTAGAGIAAPLVINALGKLAVKRDRTPAFLTLAASALTLLGGYVLRETLIEAGKASADDPREAFVQPL
ncbi:MAG TPA: NrfD/PsrC family molybdoenzyme membrane anchor subunit, partial [Candidatus Baltobacteraceae bacterium]|nr:NrfD/PsrC family molybdoenzyme membrane anchor subunit [Candidatus Baltobacteraceae bacterium]